MPLTVFVRNPTRASASGDSREPAGLTFDGDRVVLGRGASADVRLPDPSVSTRHASIRVVASEYTLLDEGSTNGTFVGGVRLTPHTPRTVRSGDLVRLGRVWVELRTTPAPLTHDLPLATRELAFALVAEAMRGVGDDTSPSVTVVEGADTGAGFRLVEEGHVYVVGRGEGCALALNDADASREHVQIVRRGSVVLLRDLGAKNGSALGETWLPTDRDVIWRRPAMLQVGRTVLALYDPVADALSELESAADEALPEGGSPPPPPPSSRDLPPPSVANTGPAAPPLVEVPKGATVAPPRASRRKSDWSATDVAVGGAAVAVIALSGAGLYWLFHG